MNIEIQRLRQITNLLFDHLIEQGVDQIELTQDFYHVIDEDELYDFTKTPTHTTVGQLTDDWTELQQLLSDPDPIAQQLTHLAALLRYIGDTVVS